MKINKILLLYFITFSSIVHSNEYAYDLAVCAIFQNEANWLKEWIEFYKKEGVQHFFLYNNNSTDNYYQVLEPYIKANEIDIIDWNFDYNNNFAKFIDIVCQAYSDCIRKNENSCKWIAMLDTDEYLFSPSGMSLPQILEEYSEYPGVAVNWVVYGTSNCPKVSYSKMLETLLYRSNFDIPINLHVKTIVQPKYVDKCDSPHFFQYKENKTAVTENKEVIRGPFSSWHSSKILRINHYRERDLEFFRTVKVPRWVKWDVNAEYLMSEEPTHNLVYDPILANRHKDI